MTKKITDSQILGELGETAVKKLVLEMGMIYEHRGRPGLRQERAVAQADIADDDKTIVVWGAEVVSRYAGPALVRHSDLAPFARHGYGPTSIIPSGWPTCTLPGPDVVI